MQLKHYLIREEDVRSCPNEGCTYAGFVNIDPASERIECASPFECAKCDRAWVDPLQRVTKGIALLRCKRGISTWCEKTANSFRKVMTAEPCPKCGVLIQKDSGCSLMRCAAC